MADIHSHAWYLCSVSLTHTFYRAPQTMGPDTTGQPLVTDTPPHTHTQFICRHTTTTTTTALTPACPWQAFPCPALRFSSSHHATCQASPGCCRVFRLPGDTRLYHAVPVQCKSQPWSDSCNVPTELVLWFLWLQQAVWSLPSANSVAALGACLHHHDGAQADLAVGLRSSCPHSNPNH